MSAVALIPARAGSERVKGKNIRLLNGVPLLAYTICAAQQSGCFDKILVSSDGTQILEIAAKYGADCIRRPEEYATSTSSDIFWVKHALSVVDPNYKWAFDAIGMNGTEEGQISSLYDTFSILRPTSPFRMPQTIQRAFREWEAANSVEQSYTSLRAVEPVSQHPGKMWRVHARELVPLLLQPTGTPMHSQQMASLPPVWVQNASLEIAWVKTVEQTGTISGDRILPFVTIGHEGFDINSEIDWMVAEQMVTNGVELPNDS